MKAINLIYSILLAVSILLITTTSSLSAVTARISGLEDNHEYMSLLEEGQALKTQEDSIQKHINAVRANFSNVSQEDRTSIGRIILDSENRLFDIRNRIGVVNREVNSIEQEYIINNLNKPKQETSLEDAPAASSDPTYASSNTNLYSSAFFVDKLSDSELTILKEANQLENNLYELENKYFANYKTMMLLKSNYASCKDEIIADTIKTMFLDTEQLNNAISDSIASSIGYVFDNKLYILNYIYDKTNNQSMLEKLNDELMKMRGLMDNSADSQFNTAVYNLPIQRQFILDQEINLANQLQMPRAVDSLQILKEKQVPENYKLENVAIQERTFIDYVDIKVVTTPAYNAKNPIPELKRYKKGTVYRIFVGSFTRIQPPSIFRSTTPIYHHAFNKMHDYYIGGFATYEQAVQAQKDLKKIGFRKPEITVWIDDVFENLSASGKKPTASSTSNAASKNLYRVEIQMNNADVGLSATHQQNIAELASGKELSRMNSEQGVSVFVVGTFDKIADAQALATALNNNADCKASVKVIP